MSCNTGAANIRIEPVSVIYGRYEQDTVLCTADIASSHNDDYFFLYSAKNAIKYHVWMNVAGAGVDPAPGGSTAIPVAFAAGASATVVAAAIAAAIDAQTTGMWGACSDGATVTITWNQPGVTTAVAAGVGLTGFVYTQVLAGTELDLGLCDGNIELKVDEKLLDITAHQTGVDILTSLRQGKTAEISITFKESDITKFQTIFGEAGEVFTPTGGTSQVVGWGTSTNSANVIDKAGKLVLHPYNASGSDHSRDWAFWKAHLAVEGVTFSGENPMLTKATFKCYTDTHKDTQGNLWVFGDHTQNFHV